MTRDELAQNEGADGQRTYIAFQGFVYDVTESKLWKNGQHMRRHEAGADLTKELQDAPHDASVFERVSRVGRLAGEPRSAPQSSEPQIPGILGRLIERVPFLRRHPHPGIVHFPIGFLSAASLFALLRLLTGRQAFETSAVYTMIAGLVVTPVAIGTGFFTWWLNYMAQPIRAVVYKIIFSVVLLILALVAVLWYRRDPSALSRGGAETIVLNALCLSLGPLSAVIGAIGGHITFPVSHH
jgi:predicted heme/steroid binding protein/uncharacterized membrane protein